MNSKPGFSVLRFALQEAEDGKLTQQVSRCGEFTNVETAFETARTEALREWQAALNTTDGHGQIQEIRLKDTEWGYELKRDHLVVTRFWVHDGQPAEIGGVQE